ncbi:protein-L-isoaspartate O-methyltransferase [Salegentibacter salarius]|uniref:Protein-L-isoaspartate O-methyltransferase n=2 Tax=Salegentibacter salarius TaxID=435906 RepID=A0A2N0TRY8_9FLAO|nr:protein-L-isoaspartate O-methyltransferase [Salegentibacter salarius]PKD17495.1 protein-L-isoaspartate O-methyltransferase [Salegentibacter salarius]
MIEEQLKGRDINNPKVLQAMLYTDRSLFVPEDLQHLTYADGPLPIGKSQTISQPYIVAYMAQILDLKKKDKVLEIGTGCGYNAAVLSRLAGEIYSIEIIEWLGKLAIENLNKTDRKNIHILLGDGYKGWPEEAPFDAIELTAAPAKIPETLKKQLKVGGKLLSPVGINSQKLVLIERIAEDEYREENLIMVSFVPMTGKVQRSK